MPRLVTYGLPPSIILPYNWLEKAHQGTDASLLAACRTHPGDEGHGMLAELLAHVLAQAVIEVVAPRPRLHLAARDADLSAAQDDDGLPLPMIPGNAATPTTLCAIEVRRALGCRGRDPALCYRRLPGQVPALLCAASSCRLVWCDVTSCCAMPVAVLRCAGGL